MVAAHVRMAVVGGETEEPMRNRGKKGARDGRAGALELGGNRRLATGKRRTEEARREAGLFFWSEESRRMWRDICSQANEMMTRGASYSNKRWG